MKIEEVKKFKVINDDMRVLRRFVERFSQMDHEEIKYMSYNELFDIVAEIAKKVA